MKPKQLLYIVIYIILLNGLLQQYLIKNQYLPFISDIIIFLLAFMQPNFKGIRKIIGTPIVTTLSILLIFSTIIAFIYFVGITYDYTIFFIFHLD